jgi:hypothetical protein
MMCDLIALREVLVAGNATTHVEIISEGGPFKTHNIVVPEEVARDFLVLDFQVGKNSQFISTGAVSAYFFARRSRTEDLAFDTLPRGMKMRLSVTNLRDEPRTFSAVLRGELCPSSLVTKLPGVLVGQDEVSDPRHRLASPLLPRPRRAVLGLGCTAVSPGAVAKMSAQPQVGFRPDYLVVPPDVLDGLKVTSLRVKGTNVLSRALDECELDFSSASPNSPMEIGDWLCVDVANESKVTRIFCGAVGGEMV